MSRSELDFLHRIRSSVRKIFFVQNKIDYLEPEDLRESVEFNRRIISEVVGHDGLEVHPLSAKTALKGVLQNDASLLERSGLPRFLSTLEDFLMREKGRLLLESGAGLLKRFLDDEYASLEMEMALLDRPREELQRKADAFREQAELITREREELRSLIQGDHKCLVQELLDEEVERFKKEETPSLLRRFDEFFERNADLSVASLSRALADFIREQIMEVFIDWRHEREVRLSVAFRTMAR